MSKSPLLPEIYERLKLKIKNKLYFTQGEAAEIAPSQLCKNPPFVNF